MTSHSLTQSRSDTRSAHSERGAAQRLNLNDGRQLAYAEYGAVRGFPLLYVHDSGSSRLEAAFFDVEARRKGFRLVALDRPGVGESDPHAAFTRESCAEDILQLADHLDCDHFGILVTGAGSGIALVTASMAPNRVAMVLGLSSQLPVCGGQSGLFCSLLRRLFGTFLQGTVSLRLLLRKSNPEHYIQRLRESLSYPDRQLLENPRIRNQLIEVGLEAVRCGATGVSRDAVLAMTPLHLDLQKLRMPVHFWQGGCEISTLHNSLRGIAAALPAGTLHRLNNRGRFFFWRHTEEVFAVAHAALRCKESPVLTTTIRKDRFVPDDDVISVAMAS